MSRQNKDNLAYSGIKKWHFQGKMLRRKVQKFVQHDHFHTEQTFFYKKQKRRFYFLKVHKFRFRSFTFQLFIFSFTDGQFILDLKSPARRPTVP